MLGSASISKGRRTTKAQAVGGRMQRHVRLMLMTFCREDRAQPGGELIAPYLDSIRATLVEAARAMEAASPSRFWRATRVTRQRSRGKTN